MLKLALRCGLMGQACHLALARQLNLRHLCLRLRRRFVAPEDFDRLDSQQCYRLCREKAETALEDPFRRFQSRE